MGNFIKRLLHGYRARLIKEWYWQTFYSHPRSYIINYNKITGPYKLTMRLADGAGMRKRLHTGTEMQERSVFLPLLKPDWICCDVGAHVGDYTVEMALLVGVQTTGGGCVKSFEAIPHYFRLLQQTVVSNRLNNVTLKLAAVGASHGTISVPNRMLTGSLANPGRIADVNTNMKDDINMVEVPIVCLNDELEHLDAIKIDCEGYEVEVLRGMNRVVNDNPQLIMFLEVHDHKLNECGSSLSELAFLLFHQFHFTVHQISYKHCICSQNDLPIDRFPIIKSPDEFVIKFRGT